MGGHIPDNGLGNIEDREEALHQARVDSWIVWLKENGGKEQDEILREVFQLLKKGETNLASALDGVVEKKLPDLVQKRIQSGDEKVNIINFPETKKPVKEGYITHLENIYPDWEMDRLSGQRKAKEYIRDRQKDINTVFSMINHTVYQNKRNPAKRILPDEKEKVLQKIKEEIAPEDDNFPRQIFDALVDQQDKKVIQEYKKFKQALDHDIEDEDSVSRRGGLPEEVLPEHRGNKR